MINNSKPTQHRPDNTKIPLICPCYKAVFIIRRSWSVFDGGAVDRPIFFASVTFYRQWGKRVLKEGLLR